MATTEEKISEILERTVRIETKIERMEELENRVAILEAQANQQKGRYGFLTALSGFAGAIIGAVISLVIGRGG